MDGGFLGITIAMIIAGATAAAQAAALGAAGAAGAIIVNKIAGGGLGDDIKSSVKKAVKAVKITMNDLSLKGKMALKSAFDQLKSSRSKEAIKSVGKKLASHFRDALAKKIKAEIGGVLDEIIRALPGGNMELKKKRRSKTL